METCTRCGEAVNGLPRAYPDATRPQALSSRAAEGCTGHPEISEQAPSGSSLAKNQGVAHISLVFREMWDSRTLMVGARRMHDFQVWRCGIPYLAKNERDMGHPGFIGKYKSSVEALCYFLKLRTTTVSAALRRETAVTNLRARFA